MTDTVGVGVSLWAHFLLYQYRWGNVSIKHLYLASSTSLPLTMFKADVSKSIVPLIHLLTPFPVPKVKKKKEKPFNYPEWRHKIKQKKAGGKRMKNRMLWLRERMSWMLTQTFLSALYCVIQELVTVSSTPPATK